MDSGDTLVVDRGSHPLATDQFVCVSEPMRRVFKELKIALKFNLPGVAVAGPPRYGKTYCAAYILTNTVDALGEQIPVLMHLCEAPSRQRSEGSFRSQLLRSYGHSLPAGSPLKKLERLVTLLIEKASHDPRRRILLVFDEANRLSYVEFDWLITIHNELVKDGVSPFYLFIGQTQLASRREEFGHETANQIIGRFLSITVAFSGLASTDEIQRCARQFDSELFWPKNTKISYSEYYCPDAFRNGWRYESHAETIWVEFTKNRPANETLGIAMQSFVAVTGFLLRKVARRANFTGFTAEDVSLAIASVAYLEKLPSARAGTD